MLLLQLDFLNHYYYNNDLESKEFLISNMSNYSSVLEWAVANPNTISLVVGNVPGNDGSEVTFGKYWSIGLDIYGTGLTVYSQQNHFNIIYTRTIIDGNWYNDWEPISNYKISKSSAVTDSSGNANVLYPEGFTFANSKILSASLEFDGDERYTLYPYPPEAAKSIFTYVQQNTTGASCFAKGYVNYTVTVIFIMI